MRTCRISDDGKLDRVDVLVIEQVPVCSFGLIDLSGILCFGSKRVVQCKHSN